MMVSMGMNYGKHKVQKLTLPRVKEINPGIGGSELQEFAKVNGVLYFRADYVSKTVPDPIP